MNRTVHALMILLFALLQSVAPFVHAHVDGNNLHSKSVQTVAQSNTHTAEMVASAEESESAAISIDNEIQREVSDTLADNLATPARFPASNLPLLIATLTNPWPTLVDIKYRYPARQAPPTPN